MTLTLKIRIDILLLFVAIVVMSFSLSGDDSPMDETVRFLQTSSTGLTLLVN